MLCIFQTNLEVLSDLKDDICHWQKVWRNMKAWSLSGDAELLLQKNDDQALKK